MDDYHLVIYNRTMERSTMLLMGKSTISMAMFNGKLLNYQRVSVSSKIIPESSSPQFPPDLAWSSLAMEKKSVALSPKRSTAAEMGDTRFSTKDSWRIAASAHPGPIHGECCHQQSLVFLDEERWSSATSPGRCFEALLNQVSFFRKRPWIHRKSMNILLQLIWIHDYSAFLVLYGDGSKPW